MNGDQLRLFKTQKAIPIMLCACAWTRLPAAEAQTLVMEFVNNVDIADGLVQAELDKEALRVLLLKACYRCIDFLERGE